MARPKLKDKFNATMVTTLSPILKKETEKHALKYDRGITSATVRQAITEYLEKFKK